MEYDVDRTVVTERNAPAIALVVFQVASRPRMPIDQLKKGMPQRPDGCWESRGRPVLVSAQYDVERLTIAEHPERCVGPDLHNVRGPPTR